MFQDGSFKTISSASRNLARLLGRSLADPVSVLSESLGPRSRRRRTRLLASVQPTAPARVYKTQAKRQASPSSSGCPAGQTDADSLLQDSRHPQRRRPSCRSNTGLNRFPFNNFTCYLTPFSRCFSSFPHGTCSLSVSCHYLALEEVYLPF